jgi:hypothetical protein
VPLARVALVDNSGLAPYRSESLPFREGLKRTIVWDYKDRDCARADAIFKGMLTER